MPKHKTNIHPEDMKALIRKTGLSVSDVGRKAGLSPSTTIHALRRPQPKGNKALAAHLQTVVHTYWPEWFNADGTRKKTSSIRPKTTRDKTICHRQKRIAA